MQKTERILFLCLRPILWIFAICALALNYKGFRAFLAAREKEIG